MIPTIGIVPGGGDEPPCLETGKPAFWQSCHSALKFRQVGTDGRVRLWNLYWMKTMSFTSTRPQGARFSSWRSQRVWRLGLFGCGSVRKLIMDSDRRQRQPDEQGTSDDQFAGTPWLAWVSGGENGGVVGRYVRRSRCVPNHDWWPKSAYPPECRIPDSGKLHPSRSSWSDRHVFSDKN
jgi:hypothetical protein